MSLVIAGHDEPGNVIDLVGRLVRRDPGRSLARRHEHTTASLDALGAVHENTVRLLHVEQHHNPGA